MPIYQREGSDHWWIDARHRGRRIRRSTGTSDREAAQQQFDELKARVWKEKHTGRQLSDALIEWLNKRPRSVKDLSALKVIRREIKDVPLAAVTNDTVAQALSAYGPGRYNRLMAIVRASLTLARRKGWVSEVPHFEARANPRQEHLNRRALTPEEWALLLAELPAHLAHMARFALATGLRWDNVALLEWDRVSFERRQVLIPGSMAKGGKLIPVPLSDDALAVLDEVRGIDPVFVFTYKGAPIGSAKTAWNKATERAGIEGWVWHGLRHTWASWHAMSGTPMEVLQELGGWSSREMVEIYRHLAPGFLAQYANNAKPQNWSGRGHKNGHSVRKRG